MPITMIRRWWHHRSSTRVASSGASLRAEELEDRSLLDAYTWDPPKGSDGNWSTPSNWLNTTTSSKGEGVPKAGDVATFTGTPLAVCNVDGPVIIRSLNLTNTFTGTLRLQNSITIAGTHATGSIMDGGTMTSGTISGPAGLARGSLILTKSTIFSWGSGTLSYLTINVGAGTTFGISSITATAPVPIMATTNIDVFGQLSWGSQDVTTRTINNIPSTVYIYPTGDFTSYGASATWGTVGAAPSTFIITNSGTFVQKAGSDTIIGNYNSNSTTNILAGSLTVAGTAQQTGGAFTLQTGSSFNLSTPQGVLNISGGTLTGVGTIGGNLTVGYDPASGAAPAGAAAAIVTPGTPAPGGVIIPGTITVTQSTQFFSGTLNITVQDRTTYSILAVNGYAALSGSVVGKLTATPGAFNNGDKLTFLTYASLIGDFTAWTPPKPTWTWGHNGSSYWFQVVEAGVMGRVQENLNGAGIGPASPGVAVTVTLTGPDGYKASTTTDSNGNYSFGDLDPGTYTLTFITASYYSPIAPETFVRTIPLAAGEQDEEDLGVYLTAQPDSASTPYETPVLINVLSNDETPTDPPLSLSLSASEPPQNGTAAVSDNEVLYTLHSGEKVPEERLQEPV